MPRFMSLIRIDEQSPFDEPDPGFEARMGALFEEITKAGVMLETAGLTPTSQGSRVTWSGGRLSQTDGPFTETKEVVGGYAILQAKDMEEALEWTRRFLRIHPESWTVTSEVRRIDEATTGP
ncbi:YciI family protein [Streptomyces sp. NPDC053720]|uniref:YciI family protein n=1 Tax=Streptomyces sp. NPDC053720 TaxID=3154855 RepID=UPI00341A4056